MKEFLIEMIGVMFWFIVIMLGLLIIFLIA